ncbi:MAG: flagellar hook protein FlgE [Candidatus Hydrogenedentes bacterium]|nr:flagellar hook protein FlgE [Candidatus Hydrogenedentota bacterium]
MGMAMLTAVTGLQAHQRKLDVIANNIANINTVGFRSSRVLFQNLFSQLLSGGSAPVGNFGGSNPQQVGLGVKIGSIDISFQQGSLLYTGVSSDLAIQGNGFFILSDGQKTAYTRDGSFDLNASGYLIDPATGMRVQGYLADDQSNIDTNQPPRDIVIPIGSAGIVRPTTLVNLIGNLDADAPVSPNPTVVTRTIEVYDSLGTPRSVTISFTKQATPANQWLWETTYEGNVVGSGALTFDVNGALPPGTEGTVTIPGSLMNTNGSQPADLVFDIDFSEVTQLATGNSVGSDVTIRSQDGFPRGVLQSFNIGANGEIIGVFSNGLTRVFAQVALATFSNVGGLLQDGNNMFLETPASGSAQVGPPRTGGRGIVSGGVLESSNVDLGNEFSSLIITQRGFQANARTITAADTLLQETVNLGR